MSEAKREVLHTETASLESTSRESIEREPPVHGPRISSTLVGYGLAGAVSAALLGAVDYVDVNLRHGLLFSSIAERAILFLYLSVNLLSGAVIGLLIGLVARAASFSARTGEMLLARGQRPRVGHRVLAALGVAGISAFLLNQHPHVYGYVLSLIREAEKIPFLNEYLLNHERSTSYLLVMALFIACSAIAIISSKARSMNRATRLLWLSVLLAGAVSGYLVDTRVEVELYEYSLRRSMFLLANASMMGLVATMYSLMLRASRSAPSAGPASAFRQMRGNRKAAAAVAALLVVVSLAFTFFYFEKNQNLRMKVFYRSTQAKQHFKLAQWILDFDRDGYSAFLGGGDADDLRGDINPGATELLDDALDNNCIGGELTTASLDEWKREHSALRTSGQSGQRLNIVFVFIDALRPDRLGAYGYDRNTSPNFDRLARRSAVFENGYSPSPNTFEALPKFMQSSYWDGHFETWTEVLARNGYNTILFPRRVPVLKRHVKGIKTMHHGGVRGLHQTIDTAIDELGKLPPALPFCAYIYISDPHRPYKKHEQFDFGSSLSDRYDGEVAYTDHHLGRLFDWMEERGRMSDTMVVIMSDHGESLGERGIHKHSSQVYEEQLRVPVLVYMPGVGPTRVSSYVSTIDLGSTMLDAVGIDPPSEYLGVSLLPLIRGESFVRPPIYGEQTTRQESPYVRLDQQFNPESKKYMVITQDGFKLTYNRNFYAFELFDLKNDPFERRNLYDRMPEKAEKLRALLGRFVDVVTVSRPWDADESKYFFGNLGDDPDL